MEAGLEQKIKAILDNFTIYGDFLSARPFGSGHIHDTYLITFSQAGVPVKYILQRVNHEVFTQTRMVCDNIAIVCNHIREKLISQQASDVSRKCMTVVPDTGGNAFFQDSAGNFWRVFLFIEGTNAVDEVGSSGQAFQAAFVVGEFQRLLSDLPANAIGESIPNFHNIAWRYENLEAAIAEDKAGRVGEVTDEILFAMRQRETFIPFIRMMESGEMPLRVTHNDTKINNVLLDSSTNRGICVIDLDTVMPGSVVYDFGDMVRTFTSPAAEDETDLSKVYLRMEIFKALTEGYVKSAGAFLEPVEIYNLVLGAKLITMIMGIRFLTDYLMGDVYYKIHHPAQNLDRCRNQFRLVQSILDNEEEMNRIVSRMTSLR